MFKFIGDYLETLLREIEDSDRTTALYKPNKTFIPILGKRFERHVYDSSDSNETPPFDALMNRIVILAILALVLEIGLGGFAVQFAALNVIVLAFFVFEFLTRWNFRRARYLRTWGLMVDGPVVLIETFVLWYFFSTQFDLGPISFPGVSNSSTQSGASLLESLGFWKLLRLARFLRVVKLVRDFALRKELWRRRGVVLLAWFRAVIETLSIFMIAAIFLLILTKMLSEQNPEELMYAFFDNVLARLRTDQDTGVKNSEVLRALYQVFTILSAMIIVTFFTQLLVPIANRIKATQEIQKENEGKSNHVVVAVHGSHSVGLIEEVIQVWAVYEGREVVLLLPDGVEIGATIHPSYSPEIFRGSIFSRASWMSVDASGADQIIILSDDHIDIGTVSTFLPTLSQIAKEHGVLVLSLGVDQPFFIEQLNSNARFAIARVDQLKQSIELSIADRNSVQFRFTEMLNDKFDKATKILGNPKGEGDTQKTVEKIGKICKLEFPSIKVNVTKNDAFITVEAQGESDEVVEGRLIQKLRELAESNPNTAPILVFVGSLHLVGVNAQLTGDHQLRVVPIELLVVYAAYHETVCAGMITAWLLPPNALETATGIETVPALTNRTTYRNREQAIELLAARGSDISKNSSVVGVFSPSSREFRGYLTEKYDSIRLERDDVMVLVANQ